MKIKVAIIKVGGKSFRVSRQNGVTEVSPLDKGYTKEQVNKAAEKAHQQWKV